MPEKLCLLCCRNNYPEVAAAIAAEGWNDVSATAFEARCGHPPLTWEELQPLLADDCTHVAIFGRACIKGLATPPEGWPPVRLVPLEECFHLVAGPALIGEALARDAYLITPAWLEDWRGRLRELGFDADNAAGFFHDFARELLLLDTGVSDDAAAKLAEFAATVQLPASRVVVGIDYTRLLLARIVTEWRLEQMQQQATTLRKERIRERADHLAAMDFLGQLVVLTDEQHAITTIAETFRMLFAPEQLNYVRFVGGVAQPDSAIPADLTHQLERLEGNWAWTESGAGFIVRITRADETLGVVVAERLAFPHFRESYLNMALSVAGVCGLAIENARSYRRMQEVEEALRKSERSLTLAQAIAHIGHWEWEVPDGDIKWSDETYRILGYDPQTVRPTADAFFQAIHPDDRARVKEYINQVQEGSRFDIEYRIVLPGDIVRVVHGMGEVIASGTDQPPRLLGILRELPSHETAEVLGVIQDITTRKELEWKLEKEAHTDPLTGCANRRYFLQQATREFTRIRRYGGDLSVLMLDLDHFKKVNDRHGHPVGDVTLKTLVQVCHRALRVEDVIGRLGGEEFAILLPETGATRALEVADRLRQAVAAADIALENRPPLHITTSIGVATVTTADAAIEVVLGRADQGLYEAKSAGRNRVMAV